MGDIIKVEFNNRENLYKFLMIAIDEGWQVKITTDSERVPMVEFCPYREEDGGPFLVWREEVFHEDNSCTVENVSTI